MTLVIMAAGLGSRFGGGIKQLQKVDDGGHIIMDYSIHDAIKAGFNKIVFIIRRDLEKDFKQIIGDRIELVCKKFDVEVSYAYQEMTGAPEDRIKPYGTGHAVLACRDIVKEPFAVINADDYYGKSAFKLIFDYLNTIPEGSRSKYCMAGFVLKNTLSENGGVTRGVCETDNDGFLTSIVETKNIVKTEKGAESDGRLIDANCCVSMNMWGFTVDMMDLLSNGFEKFLIETEGDIKAEFLIPIYVSELLGTNTVSVKVIKSNDKWFGMTYKEDIPTVIAEFGELIAKGEYSENLFDDLK